MFGDLELFRSNSILHNVCHYEVLAMFRASASVCFLSGFSDVMKRLFAVGCRIFGTAIGSIVKGQTDPP